jgi:hypothetical protein
MTRQTMQRVPPRLSPEMQELASCYQLGEPAAEYTASITIRQAIIGIIVITIAVGLFAYYQINTTGSSPWGYLVYGLFILLIIVLSLAGKVMRRAWRVYVFSHGFIFTKGEQPTIFHWEEVRAIWRRETVQPNETSYSITHRYTIDRLDGYRLVLDDKINNVEELGHLLDDRITNVMWPRALAAYNAGEVIPFGPFSVSQQGVSNGKELLPWAAVKGIEIRRGYVRIHQQEEGKRSSWAKVRIADIPNCSLFLALTGFALGK